MLATPSAFAPASNVRATTGLVVGIRLHSRPARDGGNRGDGVGVVGAAGGVVVGVDAGAEEGVVVSAGVEGTGRLAGAGRDGDPEAGTPGIVGPAGPAFRKAHEAPLDGTVPREAVNPQPVKRATPMAARLAAPHRPDRVPLPRAPAAPCSMPVCHMGSLAVQCRLRRHNTPRRATGKRPEDLSGTGRPASTKGPMVP